MKHNLFIVLLGLVAIIGIIGLVILFSHITITGGYFTTTGGGRWYYGPSITQYTPQSICNIYGGSATEPIMVFRNEYGTLLTVCNVRGNYIAVPLVITTSFPPSSYWPPIT